MIVSRAISGGLAFSALLFGASLNTAGAADLPDKTPSPPPAAYYDWTGFYVGAHAGYEWAETTGVNVVGQLGTNNTPTDQKFNGGLAGGQLGYNFQFHRVVLGIDFSGSWDGARGTSIGSLQPLTTVGIEAPVACFAGTVSFGSPKSFTNTYSCAAKQQWAIQMLPRLGYTFADGRFLPYVTGGVAFTKLSISNTVTSTSTPPAVNLGIWGGDRLLEGAVFGTGFQYGIGNALSVGVEYLYAKYSTQDFSSVGTMANTISAPSPTIFDSASSHDLTTQTVRVVVNYNLGN
jgi:outer membrane immunogenic protein